MRKGNENNAVEGKIETILEKKKGGKITKIGEIFIRTG